MIGTRKMNAEICKKCFEDRYMVKGGEIYYEVKKGRQKKSYIRVVFTANTEKFTIDGACRLNFSVKHLLEGRNKAEDIFLEDKNCPYFLEHTLYDWNNEEKEC